MGTRIFSVVICVLFFGFGPHVRAQTASVTIVWSKTNEHNLFHYAATMTKGPDGSLYGTTRQGGSNGLGYIFRFFTNSGTMQQLWSFKGGTNGGEPSSPLVVGPDGWLYGTRSAAGDLEGTTNGGALYRFNPASGQHQSLWSFPTAYSNGNPATRDHRGRSPYGRMAFIGNTLYGLCLAGQTNNLSGSKYDGALFSYRTNAGVTYLKYGWTNFPSLAFKSHASLFAGSVIAVSNKIYGAFDGGTNLYGGIFCYETNGSLQMLCSFPDPTNSTLYAPCPVLGSDGALYVGNGDSWDYENYFGGVSRVTTNGMVTELWQSDTTTGFTVGKYPGELTAGSDGNLYGLCFKGGLHNSGSVFRISTSGRVKALHYEGPAGSIRGTSGSLVETSPGVFYLQGYYVLSATSEPPAIFKIQIYESPLLVTTTNDSGPGSLRAAIEYANSNPGPDTITFAIAPLDGTVKTISPLTDLPAITETVTIDGYTQSGATTNTSPLTNGLNASIKNPARWPRSD